MLIAQNFAILKMQDGQTLWSHDPRDYKERLTPPNPWWSRYEQTDEILLFSLVFIYSIILSCVGPTSALNFKINSNTMFIAFLFYFIWWIWCHSYFEAKTQLLWTLYNDFLFTIIYFIYYYFKVCSHKKSFKCDTFWD